MKGKFLIIIVVILFLTGNYIKIIAFFLSIILMILMMILIRAFPKVFEDEVVCTIAGLIFGGLLYKFIKFILF